MIKLSQNLVIGLVVGVVVGLASGGDPAYFVMGLVLALSLAVMVFFGSYFGPGSLDLDPQRYAVAGVLALVLGFAMYRFGDSEPTWWAVGFILAGTLSRASRRAWTDTGPETRPDTNSDKPRS